MKTNNHWYVVVNRSNYNSLPIYRDPKTTSDSISTRDLTLNRSRTTIRTILTI